MRNIKLIILLITIICILFSCKTTCPAYQRGGTIDSPKTVKTANKRASKQSGLFGKNMR